MSDELKYVLVLLSSIIVAILLSPLAVLAFFKYLEFINGLLL